MIYVLAPNNTVEKYPYTLTDLRFDNPDVSFANELDNETLAEFNVFEVIETPQPSYDSITQNLEWVNPILENQAWIQQWAVVSASPEEVAEREQASKQANKNQASALLSETDWVELGDVANPANPPYLTNKADFTAYRQQLRTIAINPPITVDVWPVKPEEIWSN